jgi:SAM-dependent methyltransferase
MRGVEADALIAEQIEYYRARAPGYDDFASPPDGSLAPYGREIEMALEDFGPTGSVLEIASGTGLWTRHLLRHASSVAALDAAPEMHEMSRRKIVEDARVRYIVADVFAWEPDRRYDVVFFANWLSHVPPGGFERFWAKVDASLAPTGRVFFVDEREDAWRHEKGFGETFADDPAGCLVRRSVPDGRTFRVVKVFRDPSELVSTLDAIGWDIDIHAAGPFLWAQGVRRE